MRNKDQKLLEHVYLNMMNRDDFSNKNNDPSDYDYTTLFDLQGKKFIKSYESKWYMVNDFDEVNEIVKSATPIKDPKVIAYLNDELDRYYLGM